MPARKPARPIGPGRSRRGSARTSPASPGPIKFLLRRAGADIDDAAVVGLLGAFPDPLSRNWMRHSLTIKNAARPTARIVIELNKNGTAPPISMPMNSVGSETVSMRRHARCRRPAMMRFVFALAAGADRDDEAVEQRHGRDHRRADGDALGDGLGRVAHGVQVGQRLRELPCTWLRPSPACRSPFRRCRWRCRPRGRTRPSRSCCRSA